MKFPILQGDIRPAEQRKPRWLKVPAPGGGRYEEIRRRLQSLDLHTVCPVSGCKCLCDAQDILVRGASASIVRRS